MYELINNVPLKVKEYKGQRVVTLKDIDMVHNRPEGTARRNFNTNREYFIEGEDFFVVNQPDEIRTLGITRPQGGTPSSVILLTENGYLMLVKSLTDDLAWDVQRQLVNTYFRAKEINNSYAELLELLRNDLKSDIKEIVNEAFDERMDSVYEITDNVVKSLNKNSDIRMDNIITTIKESIKESIMKTADTTIQGLIPCFVYTRKKLKKIYKELKNNQKA